MLINYSRWEQYKLQTTSKAHSKFGWSNLAKLKIDELSRVSLSAVPTENLLEILLNEFSICNFFCIDFQSFFIEQFNQLAKANWAFPTKAEHKQNLFVFKRKIVSKNCLHLKMFDQTVVDSLNVHEKYIWLKKNFLGQFTQTFRSGEMANFLRAPFRIKTERSSMKLFSFTNSRDWKFQHDRNTFRKDELISFSKAQ